MLKRSLKGVSKEMVVTDRAFNKHKRSTKNFDISITVEDQNFPLRS